MRDAARTLLKQERRAARERELADRAGRFRTNATAWSTPIRRGAPFGIDVRLSDLYPEMYPAAGSYVASQPLDASQPGHLRYALEVAGTVCTAIVTNTPHNTEEACAIVRNLIALVEGQHVDFVAALFRSSWGAEPGRLPYLNRPSLLRRNPLLLAP